MPAHPRTCLPGQRFGHLTVIATAPPSASRHISYSCMCDCHTLCLVRGSSLHSGSTSRCSQRCVYRPDRRHGEKNSPTYWSWMAMRRRCRDRKFIAYPFYGARGVTVCDRWYAQTHGYERFVEDVGHRPADCTLDRIDVNGNYEPGNVRWAAKPLQVWNRRSAVAARTDAAEHSYWDDQEAAFLANEAETTALVNVLA